MYEFSEVVLNSTIVSRKAHIAIPDGGINHMASSVLHILVGGSFGDGVIDFSAGILIVPSFPFEL